MSSPQLTHPAQRIRAQGENIVIALIVASSMLLAPILAQEGVSQSGHGVTPVARAATDDRYAEDWVMAAVRPELRGSIRAAMPPDLPIYEIAMTLEPQAEAVDVPSLTGHLTLTYVNTTGEALETLPFRQFANGPDADHDAQIVSDVTVNGAEAEVALSESDSVLEVLFDEPLGPGEVATIEMGFASFLPIDSTSHYGIFGFSSPSDTWALAHWYPVLAGRDPDDGWLLDHPSRKGDPIFTDTALYNVTVESGPDWRLATTGIQFGDTVESGSGMIERRFVSGPVRDFTIVADEDFEVITTEVDGITINSWFNPGQEEVGEAVAQYGAQSVEIFGDILSPYPYIEMDLVPVDMHGAAGGEFPQLMYLGLSYYTGATDLSVPNALDFTVAHEVIHQWFYALVGNNQYTHAYIDEGITNYLAADYYFEQAYNAVAAEEMVESYLSGPFERIVGNDGDVIVDQPTDDFETGRDYVFAAYIKAPLGFEAIRLEIGDEAFFGALQTYIEDFTFDVAEPNDFLAAFEESSGEDLQDLWDHWFSEPAA